MSSLGETFFGKRVFITGATGFKGSWLTTWLLRLGARVSGYSIAIPTTPSLFAALDLGNRIDHTLGDVRDLSALRAAFRRAEPEFVFHLAAQSLVSVSYEDPVETFTTNVVGTLNMLEVLRSERRQLAAVIVTSDKCYENAGWPWGYRETDRLLGRDPYSASKSAAEVVINGYFHSYLSGNDSPVRIGSGRAGNVIGGGDWAADRLVPDCFRAWSERKPVVIRNPRMTRPWQFVLEPLSGYLALAQSLADGLANHGEAFNFGPPGTQDATVEDLLGELAKWWPFAPGQPISQPYSGSQFAEASLLKLACDKALHRLRWQASLTMPDAARLTAEWYREFYHGDRRKLWDLTGEQIGHFEGISQSGDGNLT